MATTVNRKSHAPAGRQGPDVEAGEICALTERTIAELVGRREGEAGKDNACRRSALRWPFPGTVEVWIPDELEGERHVLATSVDLGRRGIGLRCDEPIVPGRCLQIAIHEPEMTLHGQAVVRHCTVTDDGAFLVGLEFMFTAA